MPKTTSERQKLIEAVSDSSRELSTWTVLFHSAIAAQVGLNITDHKCLDILFHAGAMTAGQIAEITGLTTGAVTGVIDRLEAAGYARRARDPHDRRRVIVEPVPETAARTLGPLFQRFLDHYRPLLDTYSDEDLRKLREFLSASVTYLQEEIALLRADGEEG